MLIGMRFLHGFAAAAASVVINALMRDMFSRDEFSRSMSFCCISHDDCPIISAITWCLGDELVLMACYFWSIAIAAIIAAALIALYIPETCPNSTANALAYE